MSFEDNPLHADSSMDKATLDQFTKIIVTSKECTHTVIIIKDMKY